MLKTVLAGATALAIAGGSLAIAQSGQRNDARRWQPSAEEITALADLRVARIKSGLRLTAEQEQNWPAVEAAIRELAKERAGRISERRAAREAGAARPDFIERMRRGADAMSTQAAGLKKLADVTEPLYKSLDDSQKQRLAGLLRTSDRSAMGSERGPRFSDAERSGHRGHHGDRGRDGR